MSEPCELQVRQEVCGTSVRTSAGVPVLMHVRYTCSTFYCPHPGRQCGVRQQVGGA